MNKDKIKSRIAEYNELGELQGHRITHERTDEKFVVTDWEPAEPVERVKRANAFLDLMHVAAESIIGDWDYENCSGLSVTVGLQRLSDALYRNIPLETELSELMDKYDADPELNWECWSDHNVVSTVVARRVYDAAHAVETDLVTILCTEIKPGENRQ